MTLSKESTYSVGDYLNEILAKGRYSVTLSELKNRFNISEKAILQSIYRLKRKSRLAQIRKGFYAVIPPQYVNRGMVPPTLFIDDMMEFLGRDYYVSFFSAAALHGAGHQQPMQFQVMTEMPALRNIENQKLNIRFYTRTKWDANQIREKKTETGYLKVSSPELTAFDLVGYSRKNGGLNRILPILEDLSETLSPAVLVRVAKTQRAQNIQRLGYLLNELDKKALANSLFRLLRTNASETILSLAHSKKGRTNRKWNVIVNAELDF